MLPDFKPPFTTVAGHLKLIWIISKKSHPSSVKLNYQLNWGRLPKIVHLPECLCYPKSNIDMINYRICQVICLKKVEYQFSKFLLLRIIGQYFIFYPVFTSTSIIHLNFRANLARTWRDVAEIRIQKNVQVFFLISLVPSIDHSFCQTKEYPHLNQSQNRTWWVIASQLILLFLLGWCREYTLWIILNFHILVVEIEDSHFNYPVVNRGKVSTLYGKIFFLDMFYPGTVSHFFDNTSILLI